MTTAKKAKTEKKAKRVLMDAGDRLEQIIVTALKVAARSGYMYVTDLMVADEIKTSRQLIRMYVGSNAKLRSLIMTEACKRGIIPILAQGLLMGHKGMRYDKKLTPAIVEFVDKAITK